MLSWSYNGTSYAVMLFETQTSFLKVTTLNREKTNEIEKCLKASVCFRNGPSNHASCPELSWIDDIPNCHWSFLSPDGAPAPAMAKSRVSRVMQTNGESSYLLLVWNCQRTVIIGATFIRHKTALHIIFFREKKGWRKEGALHRREMKIEEGACTLRMKERKENSLFKHDSITAYIFAAHVALKTVTSALGLSHL